MIVAGDPSQWSNLLDSLVPEILDLVATSWENVRIAAQDEHEDAISERLCRCLQQNPNRATLPLQIRPEVVELDPAAGEDQGRMDIVFLLLVPREDIYFCLECKRLNVVNAGHVRSYAGEYVRFGMMRFVKGRYGPAMKHGAMVGYVLDGNLASAAKNVERAIQSSHTELGMSSPGELKPSTARAHSNFRETHHRRACSVENFCIHHFFAEGLM